MAYPRFQLSRSFKKAIRTAGSLALNSTAWADLPVTGALDLVLAAQVGDEIEVACNGVYANEGVEAALNVATIVSGAPVNHVGPAAATDYGLPGWYGAPSISSTIGAPALYTVVAGDLVGGAVTLRIRYQTKQAAVKTLYASAALPFRWHAKNLGPADPN